MSAGRRRSANSTLPIVTATAIKPTMESAPIGEFSSFCTRIKPAMAEAPVQANCWTEALTLKKLPR